MTSTTLNWEAARFAGWAVVASYGTSASQAVVIIVIQWEVVEIA